jgi:hypothetical protein
LSRPAKGGWSGVDLNGLVDKREVVLVIGELLDEFSDVEVTPIPKIGRGRTLVGNIARDDEDATAVAFPAREELRLPASQTDQHYPT